MKEVENAVSLGAVKTLLISDSLIIKARNENFYKELESIMKLAETTKAEVHIISASHDSGKKLESLGGIACILRYKIY